MVKKIARIGGVLLALVGVLLLVIRMDWLGRPVLDGVITDQARPPQHVADLLARQAATAASVGSVSSKQVLFGDFHVHTTFSFDAFMMNLPSK